MSRRALAGGYGPAQKDGEKRPRTTPAPQGPRDFALAVMRDESQPMALRASMAKAAMSWPPTRGEEQKRGEKMEAEEKPRQRKYSDLELARRISHILALGKKEEEKLAEAARTGTPAVPALSTRPAGGPPDWENSRAVVRPPLLPPREAGRVAASETSGRVGLVRDAPHPPRLRSAPSPEGEGEPSRDIYPDPHPGYRWI